MRLPFVTISAAGLKEFTVNLATISRIVRNPHAHYTSDAAYLVFFVDGQSRELNQAEFDSIKKAVKEFNDEVDTLFARAGASNGKC